MATKKGPAKSAGRTTQKKETETAEGSVPAEEMTTAPEEDLTAPVPEPAAADPVAAEEVTALPGAAESVPLGSDPGDTYHRVVVQEGGEQTMGESALVEVTKDVVRDFTYPGTQRTSQQLVATKGTITTTRQAEEMGLTSKQYKGYKP